MAIFSSFIVLLSLSTSLVHGSCKRFVQTGNNAPESFVAAVNEPYRISPGIACGKPKLTPQYYNGVKDLDKAPNATKVCPNGPHACPIRGYGRVRLVATTNMTSSQMQQIDESDVIAIALQDASDLQDKTPGRDYATSLTSYVPTLGGYRCLDSGTSGWMQWTPKFTCVVGHPSHCSGKETDAEGMPVSVCVPASLSNSFPPILVGSLGMHMSSASEAASMKGNPAVQNSLKPPNAASRPQTSIAAFMAVTCVLALFG